MPPRLSGQMEEAWHWIGFHIQDILPAGPFAISKNWLALGRAVSPQPECQNIIIYRDILNIYSTIQLAKTIIHDIGFLCIKPCILQEYMFSGSNEKFTKSGHRICFQGNRKQLLKCPGSEKPSAPTTREITAAVLHTWTLPPAPGTYLSPTLQHLEAC